MKIANHKKLAKQIADLMYPQVEASLFDAKSTQPIAIFNPLSSDKSDQRLSKQGDDIFLETLKDGRQVKTTITLLTDDKNSAIGFLRVRFNISVLNTLQDQLTTLLGQPVVNTEQSWQNSINAAIDNFTTIKHITLAGATRNQKRDLIYQLYEKGLFNYKEASDFVAKKLKTSRATIYNYLNWAKSVKKIKIHQVDTFTDKKFKGNPAGVILNAENLNSDTMKSISRELNLSETAFVFPSKKADFKLRYFTPTGDEIKFCGHSTVGSIYMLAHENLLSIERPGSYKYNLETLAGIIPVEIKFSAEDDMKISFYTPEIKLRNTSYKHDSLCEALGINAEHISHTLPIKYEETNQDLFIVANNLKDLEKISGNQKKMEKFSKNNDIVAICFLTPETFETENDIHMRCFAPSVGTLEDPFTGSVLGGLAAYVRESELIPNSKKEIGVEQGHFINRPGTVRLTISEKNGQYKAQAHAKAIHCFSSEINLLEESRDE